MIRIQHKCLITGMALACLSAMITKNRAAEKQFSFNKDIQVVPPTDSGSKIDVRLSVDKNKVKPGDVVRVDFETSTDCYLNIIDAALLGKSQDCGPISFQGATIS